jgi:hypothetical protein
VSVLALDAGFARSALESAARFPLRARLGDAALAL